MPCLVKISPVVLEKKLSTQLTTMMTTNNREILIRKALNSAFGSGELKSTIFMEYKITIDLLSIIGIENETSNLATSTIKKKTRLSVVTIN